MDEARKEANELIRRMRLEMDRQLFLGLPPPHWTYTDTASRSAYYHPPEDVIETTGRVVDEDDPPKENAIVPR